MDFKKIKQIWDAATEAPWVWYYEGGQPKALMKAGRPGDVLVLDRTAPIHKADVTAIELAPIHIQELISELEKILWACPICGKDRRDRDRRCCNLKCTGTWGTGCYCCHHQKYLKDVFEEMQKEIRDFQLNEEDRMERT